MLKDLILASRSYRSFDPDVRIPYETLCDFVDHARLSPSSINLQLLKFRIVTSQKECDAMLARTRWAGKITDVTLPPKGHAPVAYIVICADRSINDHAQNFQKDVGICAQSIMLASAEAGFGGCMLGSFSPDEVKDALSLPSHLVPQLILGLGRPDEKVVITDADEDGSVTYYRKDGVHYVQKRSLKDIIL